MDNFTSLFAQHVYFHLIYVTSYSHLISNNLSFSKWEGIRYIDLITSGVSGVLHLHSCVDYYFEYFFMKTSLYFFFVFFSFNRFQLWRGQHILNSYSECIDMSTFLIHESFMQMQLMMESLTNLKQKVCNC